MQVSISRVSETLQHQNVNFPDLLTLDVLILLLTKQFILMKRVFDLFILQTYEFTILPMIW